MTYYIIASLGYKSVKNLVCAAEEKDAKISDVTGQ